MVKFRCWHAKLFSVLASSQILEKIANSDNISALKSKGLNDESIKSSVASNKSLGPTLNSINTKLQAKFDSSCLKQDKVTFTHKKVVNIYIVNEIHVRRFTVGQMLILISIKYLVIVLDLMHAEVYRYLMVVGLVKMY